MDEERKQLNAKRAKYQRAWRAKNPKKIEQYKVNKRYREAMEHLKEWREANQDIVEKAKQAEKAKSEYQKVMREKKKRKDVINGKSKG